MNKWFVEWQWQSLQVSPASQEPNRAWRLRMLPHTELPQTRKFFIISLLQNLQEPYTDVPVHFTKHWQVQNECEQFANARALILTADNSGIPHAIILWSYSFTVLVDKNFLVIWLYKRACGNSFVCSKQLTLITWRIWLLLGFKAAFFPVLMKRIKKKKKEKGILAVWGNPEHLIQQEETLWEPAIHQKFKHMSTQQF